MNADMKKVGYSASFPAALPWYMERGVIRPVEGRRQALFPEEALGEDRIASKQVIQHPIIISCISPKLFNKHVPSYHVSKIVTS